jgi:hypothetical protein
LVLESGALFGSQYNRITYVMQLRDLISNN